MKAIKSQVRSGFTANTALYETITHSADCDIRVRLGWVLEDVVDDTILNGPPWWIVCSAIGNVYQWRNFK